MKKFIASVALGTLLLAGALYAQEEQKDVAIGEVHPPIFQKMSTFSVSLY
ncbi:hypothetical protein [Ornithinibacillus halotolerans]|uniref:Uncharacterized protein n=1 Tax=Ornithinibacillus halotolerans TaxID=1274357 RepID=A0A916W8D0_9BACI|nr:hypothetical protein [Ornithinibacillus halotolerans]GGA75538.1 hypothetical protein GCM10008025_19030 [Ornithinibacillus halotolerans]